MEIKEVQKCIRERKSVRSFDGALLNEDREKLSAFLQTVENPFGQAMEFRFLDAKEHGLNSPVVVGADTYIAAKIRRAPFFELAYGYGFEALCLYAQSMGVGTVMIAGTFNRKAFEKAMDVGEGEVMPLATPVGYPAEKRSIREKALRKVVGADKRLAFTELFYENDFKHPLSPEQAGRFLSALEMVRLAPSAVNKQPWRAVVCGDRVHFYKKSAKSLSHDELDIQAVDMGIALAHFDLTLREEGANGRFFSQDPALECGDLAYVISYEGRND